MRHQSANGFVTSSHRHTLPDHIFHQRGGVKKSVFDVFFNSVEPQFSPGDDGWCKFQGRMQRIVCCEHGQLVFLQVAVVPHGQALDQNQ